MDWKEVSGNSHLVWTTAMLEKFRKWIDWSELSQTSHQCALHPDNLERFKTYWDWYILSRNSSLELTHELLDRFADCWNWEEIIDRYEDNLYNSDFLHRYRDWIPASKLQNSRLWQELVEQRKWQLAYEITA